MSGSLSHKLPSQRGSVFQAAFRSCLKRSACLATPNQNGGCQQWEHLPQIPFLAGARVPTAPQNAGPPEKGTTQSNIFFLKTFFFTGLRAGPDSGPSHLAPHGLDLHLVGEAGDGGGFGGRRSPVASLTASGQRIFRLFNFWVDIKWGFPINPLKTCSIFAGGYCQQPSFNRFEIRQTAHLSLKRFSKPTCFGFEKLRHRLARDAWVCASSSFVLVFADRHEPNSPKLSVQPAKFSSSKPNWRWVPEAGGRGAGGRGGPLKAHISNRLLTGLQSRPRCGPLATPFQPGKEKCEGIPPQSFAKGTPHRISFDRPWNPPPKRPFRMAVFQKASDLCSKSVLWNMRAQV